MENLMQYLPFLIPVLVIEIGLAAVALVHIFQHSSYRMGNRVIWIIVVLVLQILGPILYFTLGKGDD